MTDTKPTIEASTKDICEWVLHYYGYQPTNMSRTEKWLYKLASELAASQPDTVAVPREMPDAFADWLDSQMPPLTTIGDARWWAPKIYRAMLRAAKGAK